MSGKRRRPRGAKRASAKTRENSKAGLTAGSNQDSPSAIAALEVPPPADVTAPGRQPAPPDTQAAPAAEIHGGLTARWWPHWPVITIIVCGIAAYATGLGNGFLGDDTSQIVNATPVHSLGNIFTFL